MSVFFKVVIGLFLMQFSGCASEMSDHSLITKFTAIDGFEDFRDEDILIVKLRRPDDSIVRYYRVEGVDLVDEISVEKWKELRRKRGESSPKFVVVTAHESNFLVRKDGRVLRVSESFKTARKVLIVH